MAGPVIVGYDERDESRDALVLASWLASLLEVPVRAVHVGPAGKHFPPPHGVPVVEVNASAPSKGLIEAAEELEASAIALGSSHRGRVGRVYPGATAVRALHDTDIPVAIAPKGFAARGLDRARVILVSYDGSPEAKRALEFAADLATPEDAALRVITVYPGVPSGEATGVPTYHAKLKDELHDVVGRLPPELRAEPRFRTGGDIAGVLVAEAELGVDLIVMGSRGLGPRGAAFLGSVSQRVTETAKVPVVIVRKEKDEREP